MKKITVIRASHPMSDKEFFFSVTEEQAGRIRKGNVLLVSTMRGDEIAVALCNPFTLEGDAIHLLERAGAYFPLKPVITYCSDEMRYYIVTSYLKDALQKEYDDSMQKEYDDSEDIDEIDF